MQFQNKYGTPMITHGINTFGIRAHQNMHEAENFLKKTWDILFLQPPIPESTFQKDFTYFTAESRT